jgi:histidine triad (HIT) family protein
MRDCIFCRIAAGRQSSVRIVETEKVLSFLDIAPVHYGHTLVIPKVHYQTMLDLPDEVWMEMGRVSRQVGQALMRVMNAHGFNIGMNNFDAAGQVVFHAHVHVIPRYLGDGLLFFPQGDYKPGDMEAVGQRLRQALAGA